MENELWLIAIAASSLLIAIASFWWAWVEIDKEIAAHDRLMVQALKRTGRGARLVTEDEEE